MSHDERNQDWLMRICLWDMTKWLPGRWTLRWLWFVSWAFSSGSWCSPQKVASPLASSVLPKGMNERWRGLGDMRNGIINFLFIYLSVLCLCVQMWACARHSWPIEARELPRVLPFPSDLFESRFLLPATSDRLSGPSASGYPSVSTFHFNVGFLNFHFISFSFYGSYFGC